MRENSSFWSMSQSDALGHFETDIGGLTSDDAAKRLQTYGSNTIHAKKSDSPLLLLAGQFKSPIILIMLAATAISALTGDWLDSLIIFAIVLGSAILSFFQEYSAGTLISKLRSKISLKCTVLRDGRSLEIPSEEIVPGDIVKLSVGSIVPADGIILECDGFSVNQSALTGEAMPVEKKSDPSPENAPLEKRDNCVFMGTNVATGSAMVLIARTGKSTELGGISEHLTARPPETEFERGIRQFGNLLTVVMLVMTVAVGVINIAFKKPVLDSLLFSVALAVGITPQLLPAIVNITLSRGSRLMAKEGVIVRRLTAIENFGSMEILCTDKTGTLTEGVMRLSGAFGVDGTPSETVFRLAYLNAALQTGLKNSLDEAILADKPLDISSAVKRAEIAYDFFRKRLSVVVEEDGACTLVTKGALNKVLDVCGSVLIDGREQPLDKAALEDISQRFSEWSNEGYRVLGVAKVATERKDFGTYTTKDEQNMTLVGFLLFFDRPKADVGQTVEELETLGISLRIITGDNALVAKHTAKAVGLSADKILTGAELMQLDDASLRDIVENVDLFAEVDPLQKERIVLAFKSRGHVVGYMGDGINDTPALHAADVGISVDSAVDIAKEAANFVLLEKDLSVLKRGIELGRTSFANTLKYIYITTSANFGNMFSMAGASLFMPFLPLLPKQILLINFMTDFPAMAISNDAVGADTIRRPRRWDIRLLKNFMITFGLISSLFDFLTFAILLVGFNAQQTLFQSGWFVLSVITELMQLLIMRTQKPFYKSRPAPLLLYATLAVGAITLVLPYLGVRNILGIAPLPPVVMSALIGIALLYVATVEIAKHMFFRRKTE